MGGDLDTLVERWCPGAGVTSPGPGKLELRLTSGETLPVELHAVSEDEAELVTWWSPPAALPPEVESLDEFARAATMLGSGLLRCEAGAEGVSLRMPVYLEGMSRQVFLGAVTDLGRAYSMLALSAAEAQRRQAENEAARRAIAEIEEELQQAQREAHVWSPTHTVPAGGMPAWTIPDGSVDPSTTVAEGVAVEVSETQGDWVRVLTSNGWSGWVDGRQLTPRT